jgi:hypothetical protein
VETVADGEPDEFKFVLRIGRFGWKAQDEPNLISPLQSQRSRTTFCTRSVRTWRRLLDLCGRPKYRLATLL